MLSSCELSNKRISSAPSMSPTIEIHGQRENECLKKKMGGIYEATGIIKSLNTGTVSGKLLSKGVAAGVFKGMRCICIRQQG